MHFKFGLKHIFIYATFLLVATFPCLAQASHDSEVILISKVKNSNFSFFSVDTSGNILGWKNTSAKLAKLSEIQIAAYDEDSDTFAFSKEKVLSVIPDFIKTLESDGAINALRKEIGSRIMSLAFCENQSILAGAFDSTIYRWKYGKEDSAKSKSEKEKLIERYIGPSEPISALLQHPVGRVFFAADWAGVINGFKPYDSDRLAGEYQQNQTRTAYFTSTSSRVRGARQIYSANPNNLSMSEIGAKIQKSRIEKLAIVPPDGQEIISATSEGALEIWKVRGMKVVGVLPMAHNGSLYGLAATNNYIASSGRDGTVKIFKLVRLSQEEIKSQLDRTITHKIDLVKEFPIPDVKSIIFLSDHKIVAGKKDGQVLLVEW